MEWEACTFFLMIMVYIKLEYKQTKLQMVVFQKSPCIWWSSLYFTEQCGDYARQLRLRVSGWNKSVLLGSVSPWHHYAGNQQNKRQCRTVHLLCRIDRHYLLIGCKCMMMSSVPLREMLLEGAWPVWKLKVALWTAEGGIMNILRAIN